MYKINELFWSSSLPSTVVAAAVEAIIEITGHNETENDFGHSFEKVDDIPKKLISFSGITSISIRIKNIEVCHSMVSKVEFSQNHTTFIKNFNLLYL
jgi:hypothetical protein